MKLLVCSRLPLTYGRAPAPRIVVWAPGFGVTEPGNRRASWLVFRPFSGSDSTVLPESTSPTVADSVCRTGDWPTTSIVSSRAPTSSLKSIREICFASSTTPVKVVVLKPVSAALTT